MRRAIRSIAAGITALGISVTALGVSSVIAPSLPASAANSFGPGIGPQGGGQHWGGAYVLQNVPGYAYCIQPGAAGPDQIPNDQYSPVAYPGAGGGYTDGEMAALAYFAEEYQGSGYPGWSVNDTVAAIAQIAYAAGGGTTPPASQAPAALVAFINSWIATYAGPWTISLSMNPPSGSSFGINTNYSGTVTILSATGNGVGGLQLTSPPIGGPSVNQVSNFVWLAPTTNSAGQISFTWNIDGIPPTFGGAFSAQNINVVNGAAGTAPPTYGAPAGSGGQIMLVSGSSEGLGTSFGGVAQSQGAVTGTISISKAVNDGAYYGPAGAQFQIKDGFGNVLDTLTTDSNGNAGPSVSLVAVLSGVDYDVHEIVAPPGYQLAIDQVVTVYPGQATQVNYTGGYTEQAIPAQLGAAKIDAETNQDLAGATFDFKFDSQNNGTYDQDLGSCTTSGSGVCQPPTQNTTGGWLPGWYQIIETAAPTGYWLDPATTVQTVYLTPGATNLASVTFADYYLGSLSLTKSGNDTAYWAIAGAAFTVTGPAPSTATVGILTVGANGQTNTLTGLVPGQYHLVETTVPSGYSAVAPFDVQVAKGHATTTTSAADHIQPGTITLSKTDATTATALPGATFDVRYDSANDGTYSVDLGTCTTNVSGTCSPPANDGTEYLPGNYEAIEEKAPTGYYLPTPPPTATFTLEPAGSVTQGFTDHLLVPASFQKVPTDNFNPQTVILAGAVINVTSGSTPGGPVVATCTTDKSGSCTTASVLISSQPYCWVEVSAPPGLQSGANGCFTADNAQGAQPITATDAGEFTKPTLTKVDTQSPNTLLPGAIYDLYRVDNGQGPPVNAPTPFETKSFAGQTWVAQATTNSVGVAVFPLQFPGYRYCYLELEVPANYVLNPDEVCTPGVVQGLTTTPAVAANVTVGDQEQPVTITAHKFNAASPTTVIPGAVYDLYVEGQGPPSGSPNLPAPPNVVPEQGDTWWARGTTNANGNLAFTVVAGYAYCYKEVTAPGNYVLDPGLYCTPIVTTSSPISATTVALPETLAMVQIYGRKFNSTNPNLLIPNATYEVVGQNTPPPGWTPTPNPNNYPVPAGDWYYGTATTDTQGMVDWSVPAGYSWCMHEVSAPPGYQPDTGWHCTPIVTTSMIAVQATVGLPEQPTAPPVLPFTGGPSGLLVYGGGATALVGLGLMMATRRRREGPSGGDGGGGPGGSPPPPRRPRGPTLMDRVTGTTRQGTTNPQATALVFAGTPNPTPHRDRPPRPPRRAPHPDQSDATRTPDSSPGHTWDLA